jgi:hypothetical protein
VHTIVHIQNRVILRNNNERNPYELWKGRPSEYLEANATSKEKMTEWESLTLVWTKEYLLVSQVKGNMRLNKVVESINVTIDETGGRETKEEENE